MKICICGGGNLGHVIAGFIASQGLYDVYVLTRNPDSWSCDLIVETPSGAEFSGHLSGIYKDAHQAVANADIVLLCLPGYAIREVLIQIKNYLSPKTAVGSVVSSTGFFFEAMDILSDETILFGFHRTPFISRIVEYGHRVRLLGYKKKLNVAIERARYPEVICNSLEKMFKTYVQLQRNFYEVTLSNSNPLLHPARLYDLWSEWHEGMVYQKEPLFYEEWTERAASLYIAMDEELQHLLKILPVEPGSIPTVLEYYESTDAASLAMKLRSIEAFKGIKAPMKKLEDGYLPNFQSRYFTEDFPFGLAIIQRLAKEKGITTPIIDQVCIWGMGKIETNKTPK